MSFARWKTVQNKQQKLIQHIEIVDNNQKVVDKPETVML